MVSQNIGNGTGMLYATDLTATKIISCTRNDAEGVRNMRTLGAGSAPIAAERSAVATVTFTAVGGAGNITAVTIAAVNQIGGNVAATVGDPTQTATDVAAAINSYTPGSGVDFTANSIACSLLYIQFLPGWRIAKIVVASVGFCVIAKAARRVSSEIPPVKEVLATNSRSSIGCKVESTPM